MCALMSACCGRLSRECCSALSLVAWCSGAASLWQPLQLQPTHRPPRAKHSQYSFRQRDFLHEQGLCAGGAGRAPDDDEEERAEDAGSRDGMDSTLGCGMPNCKEAASAALTAAESEKGPDAVNVGGSP